MAFKSLNLRYRLGVLCVLAAISFLQSGCLLAAAGIAGAAAAGTAYAKGKICALYNARPTDAWAATKQAVTEMGMPILKEEFDGAEGMIQTRTAEGEMVRIYLEARTSAFPSDGPITKICIRVATFGDWPISERIMAQIGSHLAPPSAVVPAQMPLPGPPPSPIVQAQALQSAPAPQTTAPPLATTPQSTPPGSQGLPAQPIPIAK